MNFPVDDVTLNLIEHSMGGALHVDDDGQHVFVGADMSIPALFDFLAGHNPDDYTVIREADPFRGGWDGAEIVEMHTSTFSRNDAMRAMIAEIRRLRELVPVGFREAAA